MEIVHENVEWLINQSLESISNWLQFIHQICLFDQSINQSSSQSTPCDHWTWKFNIFVRRFIWFLLFQAIIHSATTDSPGRPTSSTATLRWPTWPRTHRKTSSPGTWYPIWSKRPRKNGPARTAFSHIPIFGTRIDSWDSCRTWVIASKMKTSRAPS